MELLINAIPLLGERTGVGNYARRVAQAAAASPDFDCSFFYGYYGKNIPAEGSGAGRSWLGELKKLAKRRPAIRYMCKKAIAAGNTLYQLSRRNPYDCYFEPNFTLIPGVRARRVVVAVHDFSCFIHPQWHPAERVRHMERHFWASIARADAIVTVSETIRREAIEKFGISPALPVAIPNGVDHDFYRPQSPADVADALRRYGLPEKFLLYVGAIEPRKNLKNLLLAHASLPDALKKEFPLVLAGSKGWNNADILELLGKSAPHARLLGYVPQNDLPLLYSAASLFVYPSWYEGFGLPVLEAMACGCPALASDDAALMELSAGAAMHTAGNVEAIRSALARLLADPELRASFAARALQRAASFSWQKSTDAHLRLFAGKAPLNS